MKKPQPCGCECGGMTKGGRFLPGHDSIYASKLWKLGVRISDIKR